MLYRGEATTFEATALLPATHYAFRVRARAAPPAAPPAAAATHRRAPQLPPSPLAGGGADGTVGEWSDAVAVRTESAPPAAPEAPALVRADSRAVALSWAAVHDDGGAAVVRYELRVDASDDTTPPRGLDVPPVAAAAPNLPPPRVQARVDNLPAGVACTFRVRAVSALGAGPWSAPAQAGTLLETPPPPRALARVAPRAGGLSRRGEAAAAAVGGGEATRVVGFEVQLAAAAASSATPATVWRGDGDACACELRGLAADTEYVCRVRASNAAGAGEWSDAARGRTAAAPPPTPAPPVVVAKTSTTMTLRWTPNDDDADDAGAAAAGGADVRWELEVDQGERVTMDSDGNEQQEDPAREAQLRALLEMGAGAHLNPAQRASLLQPLSGGSHLPPLAIGPAGLLQPPSCVTAAAALAQREPLPPPPPSRGREISTTRCRRS